MIDCGTCRHEALPIDILNGNTCRLKKPKIVKYGIISERCESYQRTGYKEVHIFEEIRHSDANGGRVK